MDNERVARELVTVAKELSAASGKGLLKYKTKMWQAVANDLKKALNTAFSGYGKVTYAKGEYDNAYIVLEGHTKTDLAMELAVHLIERQHKYLLLLSGKRGDWSGYPSFVEREYPNGAFDAKEIANWAVRGIL